MINIKIIFESFDYGSFLFKENILSKLTLQQKKTLAIASAALACLAACYIVKHFFSTKSFINPGDNLETEDKQAKAKVFFEKTDELILEEDGSFIQQSDSVSGLVLDGWTVKAKFKNDKLNGHGKIIFANGMIYEGEFQHGQLNGQGKMIFANGTRYEGEFQNDKLHGQGKITFATGTVCEGQFQDGLLNGPGKRIFSDGRIEEGEFKDDKLYKSLHPQIQISKKQVKLADVEVPPYISSSFFEQLLDKFGPTATGICEEYVWQMRKCIFGFSIGQKERIKKLSMLSNIKVEELKKILEGGWVASNMLYMALYLKEWIPHVEATKHNIAYLNALKRLHADLQRSLPFAFILYKGLNDDTLDQIVKDVCQELKQMKSDERLLIPIGFPNHATLLVFQKMIHQAILPTHYNTGLGVKSHLTKELSLKGVTDHLNGFIKNHFPIAKTYPIIDLGMQSSTLESLMTKLLKLKAQPKLNTMQQQLHIEEPAKLLEEHLGQGIAGPAKPVQLNGVCSFQILTEVCKDILGSKRIYNTFKRDFLTYIQRDFQEITDAMESLIDDDPEIEKLYPLHCLLLKQNRAQIEATEGILARIA